MLVNSKSVGGIFFGVDENDLDQLNDFLFKNEFYRVDWDFGISRGRLMNLSIHGHRSEKPLNFHHRITLIKRNFLQLVFNVDEEIARFKSEHAHSKVVKQKIIYSHGSPTEIYVLTSELNR